ncbi:MAG: EamA family transporter [Alphaproteobacteria bacterium]|nr:EamA family transporter [Alphaproteobacteria bacterium]
MDSVLVAAALFSAFLHAAWNAAIRQADDTDSAMAAQVVTSGLIGLPLLLFFPLPGPAAWPWLAASTGFNMLAMLAILRGYAAGGGFGLVYPVTRAVSPLLVALLAVWIMGERLSALGLTGVALIAGAVGLFAVGQDWRRPGALAWSVVAGVFSAAYIVCDAQGARASESALGYGAAMSVVNALAFGAIHTLRGRGSVRLALRTHARMAALASSASMTSYLLIIWVYAQASVAIGAALRDTSIVFSAIIAALVLKEAMGRWRIAAIGLAVLGVIALRLA